MANPDSPHPAIAALETAPSRKPSLRRLRPRIVPWRTNVSNRSQHCHLAEADPLPGLLEGLSWAVADGLRCAGAVSIKTRGAVAEVEDRSVCRC